MFFTASVENEKKKNKIILKNWKLKRFSDWNRILYCFFIYLHNIIERLKASQLCLCMRVNVSKCNEDVNDASHNISPF